MSCRYVFNACFGASNFVPYVLRLFLILPRTSHSELHSAEAFFFELRKNSTPNELHMKLSTIVEKLVIEKDYDARTYGPIILQE